MNINNLPYDEFDNLLSKRIGKYSIKRKYLKLALVVSSLFFLFASSTMLFVFFQINQNSYNLEYQRIKSIFPAIERAVENEIIIGNTNELQTALFYLKKTYNLNSIEVSKTLISCASKTVLIKKYACNTFVIDKFKEPIYIKIMNKVDKENLHYLIWMSILMYLTLFTLALVVLYFSLNNINKILIYPLIQLAKNPIKWITNKTYKVRELEIIRVYLEDYYLKINETKIQEEKIKIQSAINEISLQIVHDLRSPISALNTLKDYVNFDLITHKDILNNCIMRMECLVGELLHDNGNILSGQLRNNNTNITNISEVISSIVHEKNILLTHENKSIQIHVNGSDCVKAFVNVNKLTNIISNLLNNSIEAIKDAGQIVINVTYIKDFTLIEIIDDGKGIPQIVLDTFGAKKISINKQNGHGIGLYSAFNYLKLIGGELNLSNNELSGAKVSIKIPFNSEASLMENSKTSLTMVSDLMSGKKIVLLDDSQLVIDTWKLNALEDGVDFSGFTELEPFIAFTETLDKDTIFYVDSNLGYGLKGEDIVEKLYHDGFCNLYIATGYDPEKYKNVPYIKGIIGKIPPFGKV